MKKRASIKKILTAILIITMSLTLLLGCNSSDEEVSTKPTYAEIWDTYDSATTKTDTMSVATKVSYYNNGTAEYINPKVDMVRTMDDDLVLIDGVFYAGTASSGASTTASMMGSLISGYLDKETVNAALDLITPEAGSEGQVYFMVGSSSSAINAKLDYVWGDEEPDYELPFSSDSMLGNLASFSGISMDAVDTLLQETGHSYFMGLDVAELLMYADILSLFDMTTVADSQESTLNATKGAYLYSYTLTDEQIKSTVVDMIESQFSYLSTQMEEEQYTEFKRLYDAYSSKIYDMITVASATLTMVIPEDLQTVSISCNFNVDVSISKTAISSILENEPQYADLVDMLDLAFTLASGFGFGSKTKGVTGVIDFNMDVSMTQVIEYADVTLDADDEIFTSADDTASGRYFYYFEDEEYFDKEGHLNLSVRLDK